MVYCLNSHQPDFIGKHSLCILPIWRKPILLGQVSFRKHLLYASSNTIDSLMDVAFISDYLEKYMNTSDRVNILIFNINHHILALWCDNIQASISLSTCYPWVHVDPQLSFLPINRTSVNNWCAASNQLLPLIKIIITLFNAYICIYLILKNIKYGLYLFKCLEYIFILERAYCSKWLYTHPTHISDLNWISKFEFIKVVK